MVVKSTHSCAVIPHNIRCEIIYHLLIVAFLVAATLYELMSTNRENDQSFKHFP